MLRIPLPAQEALSPSPRPNSGSPRADLTAEVGNPPGGRTLATFRDSKKAKKSADPMVRACLGIYCLLYAAAVLASVGTVAMVCSTREAIW